MQNKYRVTYHAGFGYKPEIKRWWLPIWLPFGFSNHVGLKAARIYIAQRREGLFKWLRRLQLINKQKKVVWTGYEKDLPNPNEKLQ